MDELIAHVSEKTYAYGAIRAKNQNLLFTISELETRLENIAKGKSVNTKFDKTNGSQTLLCVTPLNKHVFHKTTDVPKSEENHVVSKLVTLQTSLAKQRGANSNKNVIAPGMYKVVTTHESQTNETKHGLSSTGINAASSVRRQLNRDSHVKNSVLANSKKSAKKVTVYVRKNKQTDNTSENVISNKENIIDVDVANASKAKTLLCVSCIQNVLIPCHDKCLANYKLNVHSNVRRTLSTKSKTPKSSDTNYVVLKTRFSENSTLSKSLDTTSVVSKPKIDVGSASQAKNKIRTDNDTKFKNATLKAHYEKLGIMQQFLTARTPQQNGVVERRNRTLVEAARIMLIFSRLPEFLWAEAVATACFTQNRSIIHTRYNKTPYELLRDRKSNVEYFHVFGSLCYLTNDRDDLGKMKPKADIGVFIGYSETSRGFRIYNRRTKKIMETIHVKFDELIAMASEHDCLEPELQRFNNHNSSAETMNTPSKEDLDNLFGPMFEEYFEKKFSDTPINSAA
ncbi:retrovirus-related pol polyprotein from transposon TNT 1-94 [Tanacetum coccineum]